MSKMERRLSARFRFKAPDPVMDESQVIHGLRANASQDLAFTSSLHCFQIYKWKEKLYENVSHQMDWKIDRQVGLSEEGYSSIHVYAGRRFMSRPAVQANL